MNYVWNGSGCDSRGVKWYFTLDLLIDGSGSVYGSFDWDTSDEDIYGVEYVSGTVDDDGRFEMEGKRKSRSKNIVICSYKGRFYSNYSRIEGNWTGDCPSGKFSGN
jgi:hypothetical protein